VAAPTAIAGKILHWTQVTQNSTPTSPDPSNGKARNSEVWVQIGQDNVPTQLHARTTLVDGTFLQEIVATTSRQSVYLSAAYSPSSAKPPPVTSPCPLPKPSSGQFLSERLPLFADQGMLPSLGFQATAGTQQLPTTPPLAGAKPSASYQANPAAPIWTHSVNGSGSSHLDEVQVDNSGRVQMVHSRTVDTTGHVNETKMSYGNLDVYEPSAVPQSVFNPSQGALESCHG